MEPIAQLITPQADQLPELSDFVLDIFTKTIKPLYPEEGYRNFKEFVQADRLGESLQKPDCRLQILLIDGVLAGMYEMRINHITLFFVGEKWRGQRLSYQLMADANTWAEQHEFWDVITLNAAPPAIPVYRKMGFIDLRPAEHKNGMSYQPMYRNVIST